MYKNLLFEHRFQYIFANYCDKDIELNREQNQNDRKQLLEAIDR